MSYTIPGCYTTDGKPVVVVSAADTIRPQPREERANPAPARAQANLDAARRLQSPVQQPGMR